MRVPFSRSLICASLMLTLAPAHADLSNIRINGFGQVVGGTTFSNDHPSQGYGADPKFDQESLYALQISAPLASKLTATAQLVGKGTEDFKPKFEWAYVNYQFNNDWSIKAGRQRVPFFSYSDTLEVGVSLPWLRTPTSVYDVTGGFGNADAVSLSYSHAFGNWQIDPELLFGQYSGGIKAEGIDGSLELKNLAGLALHAGYSDWLSLRAAYFVTRFGFHSPDFDGLVGALDQSGFQGAGDELATNGDTTTFLGFGAEINYAHWQVISEYVEFRANHSFIGDDHAYYLAIGRHFGRFLPMFTFGRANASSRCTALSQIPDVPQTQPLREAVSTVIAAQVIHDSYYQFDLRYDLSNNVALKFNYTGTASSVASRPSSNLLSAGVAYSF